MPDWLPITPFSDDEVVIAEKWQNILANINGLQQGEHEIQPMPGPADASWTTSSTSFVDIDLVYYRQTIQSYGGDLLIVLNLELYNGAAAASYVQITIDGVAIGNSDGLHYKGVGAIFETVPLVYIAQGVAAGEHTIVGRFASQSGLGTATIGKDEAMSFWITELH